MSISLSRSRLRIDSRETGSAVPSRVSLLILHTQAEYGAYSQDSSRFPRRRAIIYTANRQRISPEFIRSRNCIPMGVYCRESAGTGPRVFKEAPVTGAAFSGFTLGPIYVRLSFPTPTNGIKWACTIQKNVGGCPRISYLDQESSRLIIDSNTSTLQHLTIWLVKQEEVFHIYFHINRACMLKW